jgi:hypothetical protein
MAVNPLQTEGVARLSDCRRWKSMWNADLREAYVLGHAAAPAHGAFDLAPPTQRILDAGELNTDIGIELAGDFATEVINTYMPEATPWCERGKGMFITKEQFETVASRRPRATPRFSRR